MIINPSRFQMPQEPVTIEYTNRGRRVVKVFQNAYSARRFWILKDKQGRNPKVKKPEN
jgi:hypothetical protein